MDDYTMRQMDDLKRCNKELRKRLKRATEDLGIFADPDCWSYALIDGEMYPVFSSFGQPDELAKATVEYLKREG